MTLLCQKFWFTNLIQKKRKFEQEINYNINYWSDLINCKSTRKNNVFGVAESESRICLTPLEQDQGYFKVKLEKNVQGK